MMRGTPVIPGNAQAKLLASSVPLSFWGGYDATTGEIIDRRHPLSGQCAAGRALAVPITRGSSTTTAVILEAVRSGTAPAIILTIGVDTFLALASVVADEFYGKPIPIVALSADDFSSLTNEVSIAVAADGTVTLQPQGMS
jgi:predicted aconitase with swiveling domain